MPSERYARLPFKDLLFTTTGGSFKSTSYVKLKDFRLPEFNRNRNVATVKASVLDNAAVKYDLILGRDFLNSAGVDVKSSSLTCEWCGDSIPFKLPSYILDDTAHRAFSCTQTEPQIIVDHEVKVTSTATKSTFADIEDVVVERARLDSAQ